MSARDRILNSVAANKPNLVPLPDMFIDRHIDRHSLQEQFIATLTKIGGTVIRVNSRQEIAREMNSSIALGEHVVNTVRGLSELTNEKLLASNATALEPVHKAYIEGTIGVAENGSIWLYESQMINRLLPFICQHLIIVLPADAIVADMHEAYKSVRRCQGRLWRVPGWSVQNGRH